VHAAEGAQDVDLDEIQERQAAGARDRQRRALPPPGSL